MNIKFGLKKATIVLTAALLSVTCQPKLALFMITLKQITN